jgi:hypothetical protein
MERIFTAPRYILHLHSMLCLISTPMRFVRFHLPFALALSILAVSARADFVILKSGERVEGKIEEENDKSVTIQVQMGGVIDDKVIKKSDIARMSKTTADESAYQAIMNLQPGPNSLSSAQYAQIITYLNDFVVKYPGSAHAAEIKDSIKGFAEEKKRVDAGEVKMNGDWLTKEQALIQRVQVGGAFAFENMKRQSASGDFVGALDSFVQIEKTYTGARTYPEAIELAKQVIVKMGPLIDTALVNEQINKTELERGWKNAGAKDRKEMMDAYARDQAQAEATAKYEETKGDWPPFRKDSEKCLKALQTKLGTEHTRLAGLQVANFRHSVELSDQAAQQVTSGQDAEAKVALKDALSLWPANEAAKRLQEELAQVKAAPANPLPPLPTPTPVRAAAPPSNAAAPSKTTRP